MWCRNLPRTLQQQTPLQGQRRKHSWKNVRANTQTQWCGQDRNLILMKTCGCWVFTLEWGTEAPLAGSSGCRPSRESLQIVLTGVFQWSDTYNIQTVESYCILAYHHFFSLRSFPPLVLAASYCAAKSSQFHSTLLPAIANNVNSGGNLVFLCICPSGALCLVFRLPLFQPDIVSDCSAI